MFPTRNVVTVWTGPPEMGEHEKTLMSTIVRIIGKRSLEAIFYGVIIMLVLVLLHSVLQTR